MAFSPASPTIGQTVTATVTMNGVAGVQVPSGSVQYSLNGAALAPAGGVALNNGVAQFTFTAAGSPAPNTVQITYSGDNQYVTITPAASTLWQLPRRPPRRPSTLLRRGSMDRHPA